MSIKLGDYFKDTSNVFTEEEAVMIYKRAGYIDLEDQKNERVSDLKKLICAFCEKEIIDDGEFVIKSYVRGVADIIHNDCHFNYLIENTSNECLTYEEVIEDN